MFNKISPEKAGISSKAILDYVKTLESYNLKTHSIIFAKGNDIFAECYYKPFNKDFKHRMYSMSKSITAIAIGLAEQEGLLSLDDKFMDYLPEYANKNLNDRFYEATIRDMLTMRSCMCTAAEWWGFDDRAAAYFSLDSRQIPGTNFAYDSPGSFMLGCIVEKVTGKLFLEYLKEKIFVENGFSEDAYCLLAPGGHSHCDSGVMCTARDLLIIARLLMNKGVLNGKRYLNEEFVTTATSKITPVNRINEPSPYTKYGYGYLIWKGPRDGFLFSGLGDQYVVCDPKTDVVFIINSENCNAGGASQSIIFHELYKIIEKVGEPLEESPEDYKELCDYLDSRELICLKGETKSPILEKINGKKYILEENVGGIEYMIFTLEENSGVVEYKNADGINKIKFGMGYNIFDKFPGKKRMGLTASEYVDGQYDCGASAIWSDENTLSIMTQIIDTYLGTLVIKACFKDNRVSLTTRRFAQRILYNYEIRTVGYCE